MKNNKQLKTNYSIYKKIGIFLLRIPIFIIKIPLVIIRLLSRFLKYLYISYMYSIRRSLTATFLLLYSIIAVLTFFVIIGGFLYFELEDRSSRIYTDTDAIIASYVENRYDAEEITRQITTKATSNGSDYILALDNGLLIQTTFYSEGIYPKSLISRIGYIFSEKLYTTVTELYYVSSENQLTTGKLTIIQPIEPYYDNLIFISILYLICYFFGIMMIWIIGSLNIRKVVSPLFTMTLTAKKLSIRNMEERLDVSKAKYELKDLAITLNDMLDRLSVDYNKQKRFVSDVSHELRTPISIVNGYANMLERWGKEDEDILDEAIEAIISEAKSMQVLVENLLTLVRSDNQTLVYDLTVFNLDELVSEVCKETTMINEKQQQINCEVLEPVQVQLDYQKTKQMLRIFMDNAVKYTPELGEITISCYHDNHHTYLQIKDSGIGISNEDLPYLFDRFYRSDESRTRQTGGHGLGLSIAKVIVLGHGGSIRVKSKLNAGSEFIVELPILDS